MTPELQNKFIHPCFWDNWLRYRTGVYYIPICKGFVDTGTTGECEPTTFVAALLSSSLWLLYGIAISDTSTIIVNSIGALLQFSYVVTYYIYAIRKSQVLKYMAAFIVVLLLTLLYLYFDTNPDRKRYHMGLICTFVTIMFFAAPLVTLLLGVSPSWATTAWLSSYMATTLHTTSSSAAFHVTATGAFAWPVHR
ncbi:sugar transporter SWEET1-like isoform X3 [Schistocerca cancellata]|uniref:sugar transporter SWEET1-like isoform X3 n=1 Tax=Schistocerca cancellata TaxID=274614 RepID=UPI0021179E1A|nr:sugar transporter SWEET1-like isoform X3 [Schistocerca cancellata]